MRHLVVAAHPDDEVLGCGGTIARLTALGHDVFVVILGEGITSRFTSRDEADAGLVEALHEDCIEVGRMLGVKKVFHFAYPDNRFDSVPLLDIVKNLEEVIDDVRPEVLYTQHGGDLNIDHAIAFRATVTATRPMVGCPVRELYCYEVPSSTEWAFGVFEPRFRPSVFVDIHDTLDVKIQAMEHYEGEKREFPHPRSPEAMAAQARHWGSAVGLLAAEAFEPVRIIKDLA